MPRSHISSSKGRRQPLTGPRQNKSKSNPDDTYQDQTSKKRKRSMRDRATTAANARKRTAAAQKREESTTSGGSADEADEEDDDDEEDEPAVLAPSRVKKGHAAGRFQYDRSDDNLSINNDTDSMFGDEEFNDLPDVRLDDDEDDDELYQKVDDISDSDIDNVSQKEMHFLEAELTIDGGLSAFDDDEDPSFYLNQIEGMSAYGFGETSDADGTIQFHISSQSSDDGNPMTLNRHVRFEESFPESRSAFRLSQSPTMTRALLPSALPQTMSAVADQQYGSQSEEESSFDSDVTEDCLPEAAADASDIEDYIPDEPSPSSLAQSKLRQGKGPPTGTFIDEGDKSAGTLDSTGKTLIITNPHYLGEEFARRYGASAPPSPGPGFAEAVFGDDSSQSVDDVNATAPDPTLSCLTGATNIASNGQAMGPPEAWYPDLNIAESALLDDDQELDADELSPAEREMRLEDVIAFGTDSDDDDSPTSPAYMSSDIHATPRHGLAHLNTGNIMAFRRGTDPTYVAMQSSPPAPHHGLFATPKPPRNRKRKARNNSPYSTPIYKGVTPVQRTARSSYTLSSMHESPAPVKRRKTMA